MQMEIATISNDHYEQASGIIKPLDFCRFFPFNFGNFVKYVLRAPYKGDELGDLTKALVYIKLAKQDLENMCSFKQTLNYTSHLASCFNNTLLQVAFETDDYLANFNKVIALLEFETDVTCDDYLANFYEVYLCNNPYELKAMLGFETDLTGDD